MFSWLLLICLSLGFVARGDHVPVRRVLIDDDDDNCPVGRSPSRGTSRNPIVLPTRRRRYLVGRAWLEVGEDEKITDCNEATEQLSGYARATLVGAKGTALLGPGGPSFYEADDDFHRRIHRLRETNDGTSVEHGQTTWVTADGRRILLESEVRWIPYTRRWSAFFEHVAHGGRPRGSRKWTRRDFVIRAKEVVHERGPFARPIREWELSADIPISPVKLREYRRRWHLVGDPSQWSEEEPE
jgi:PAS domain S-box-containing protein